MAKAGSHPRPIYMDHHATTPVDRRVLEVMLPFFTQAFGNAASVDHVFGGEAQQAVERARDQVARGIGASADEIVFTSGATEANNLAILGAAHRHAARGRHVVTCTTEHHAVLDPCHYLEGQGWRVTRLSVDGDGRVDPSDVRDAITDDTVLVSLMLANNEVGTIAPLAEVGRITREAGVLLHTDATQAVGHIPVDVEALHVDLLSLSAHKLYGPKGVGALYVRRRSPRVKISAHLHGGGHERGLRSGTLNVPGIVGLGEAVDVATHGMGAESRRLLELRDLLWKSLLGGIDDIQLNGHPTQRLPHNLSVYVPGVESRSLLVRLKNSVALSTGSACTTTRVEPSHVILAMGFGEERAHSTLRFGLGRGNTSEDIARVAEFVIDAVHAARSFVMR